jgi:hypothetical protein
MLPAMALVFRQSSREQFAKARNIDADFAIGSH